jgi:predicted phage tail protein
MVKKKRGKTKGTGYIPFISGMCIGKKCVRGLGLFFFLVGAVLIMTSFFGGSVTGRVIFEGGLVNVAAVAGILLEVIGITLMVIKIKGKGVKSNKYPDHYKHDARV